MAREYAQIKLSIWADDDWRDLSPLARYLYVTILTSPTLSHCGVADWRPRRIAALNGMEADEVEDYGDELVERLYFVIDHVSEEVLIRSFIRNDGLMKQPKMAVAMASAHAAVASKEIRGVIVHEVKRLHEDMPNLHGWGSEKASELLGMRSINPSTYPLGKGSVKGSRKGKTTPIGKGSVKGSPTPAPVPAPTASSLSPVEAGASTTKSVAVPDVRDDVLRVCDHLADAIEANGSLRPEIGKGWHTAARLMIDKDGRPEEQIVKAINWATSDEFWRANILSMPKLREKFDTLRLQAARTGKPQANKAEQRMRDNLAVVEQLRAEEQQTHLRAIESQR